MDPKIWGPSAWLFLHTITFNYPNNPTKEDKENIHKFFDSLKYTIPCRTCKEHYKDNLKNIPIKLDSKDDLIEWLFDIHNSVNKFKGGKIYSHENDSFPQILNGTVVLSKSYGLGYKDFS